MLRLEQITALALAAALAIPSYWFFGLWLVEVGMKEEELEKIVKID